MKMLFLLRDSGFVQQVSSARGVYFMKCKADLAKGWLLKGDSDLATAKCTAGSEGPYDTACFHAQQAVEK